MLLLVCFSKDYFSLKSPHTFYFYRMLRLLAILCMLYVCSATAQHPYYYAINDDNGLPGNEVYYLLQDPIGYMWVGTNEGLYRYDGTDFIPYAGSNTYGRAISHLQIDGNSKLWGQNFSGQIFSIAADSLTLEYNWANKISNFPAYCLDKNDNVWLTADSGIYAMKGNEIKQYYNLDQLTTSTRLGNFNDLCFYNGGIYYTEKYTIGFIINGEVKHIKHTNKPERWDELYESSVFLAQENRLLLLSRGKKQSALWEVKTDSIIWMYDLPTDFGRAFSMHNADGKLWVGGSNGALCLDNNFEPQFDGRLLFPGKSVSDVMLDREGNHWFSTLQDGIFIVPSTDVWVYTAENSKLADTRVKKLAHDADGNLYIGYQNGQLSKLDLANNNIQTIAFPNSFADVQCLYMDTTTSNLFIGQYNSWLVDIKTMTPRQVSKSTNTKCATKLPNGRYLLGATVGAYTANLTTEAENVNILRGKRTNAVFFDKRHNTQWVCYADGLYTYTDTDFAEVILNGQSIFGTAITQTQDGTIWVSTLHNGVLGIQDNTIEFTLNNNIGLTNGTAKTVAALGNTLWIVGSQSLITFSTETNSFKRFGRFDGLPSMEISDISFANNHILLATPKGLVSMPTDLENTNPVAPVISLTSISIQGRDTILTDKYTLPHYQNNLLIRFKGLAFRSRGAFTYQYRLTGLSNDWITTTSASNFARYPSLPPGNYTFEVIAVNEDGIPSASPAIVSITILRPFWMQWWFYTLCGLTIVAVVSAGFTYRIRNLRKRNQLEMRMANSQLAALKSQMNPHFMFNALNSIQDLVLQQDTDNAQLYLGKFAELTRKVLQASGKEFISLNTEVEILTLYLDLEKLRFGDDFRYEVTLDEHNDIEDARIPSMLLQPFVENALKHGLLHKQGNKLLTISFGTEGNLLVCQVIDNGVGRAASTAINARKRKHSSFATEATMDRLKLLNDYYHLGAQLEITDLEQGTAVKITLPKEYIR